MGFVLFCRFFFFLHFFVKCCFFRKGFSLFSAISFRQGVVHFCDWCFFSLQGFFFCSGVLYVFATECCFFPWILCFFFARVFFFCQFFFFFFGNAFCVSVLQGVFGLLFIFAMFFLCFFFSQVFVLAMGFFLQGVLFCFATF